MNASGRDDTALMNALLNGVVQTASWLAVWARVPLWEIDKTNELDLAAFSHQFDIAVLGDDSITMGPRQDRYGAPLLVDAVEATIALAGFECKIAVRETFSELVYLGCRPWVTDIGPVWGPTLGRRLYKHHVQRVPTKRPLQWLAGIVHFESKDYSHLPVLGPIALRTQRILTDAGVKRGFVDFREHKFHYRCADDGTPSPRAMRTEGTIRQFCKIYGVSASALSSLEDEITGVTVLPSLVQHPVMDRIFEVDEL
jgi:hypothetical protein